MAKRATKVRVFFVLCFIFTIFACHIYFLVTSVATEKTPKLIIFDTDMAADDDAWALRFVLMAEEDFKMVKILAVTTTHGNAISTNAIENTYRILVALNRTDVRHSIQRFIFRLFVVEFNIYEIFVVDSNLQRRIGGDSSN